MTKRWLLAVVMSLVCALGVMGLAACGGGNTGGGSADSAAAADTAADEQAIKDDLTSQIQGALKSALMDMMQKDSNYQSLAQAGMDLDSFADKFITLVKLDVTSVDVNGDSAVAHLTMTVPDFNAEESTAALDSSLTSALESLDPSTMTQEEIMDKLGDVIVEGLSSPDVPTMSESVDVEYTKSGDTWTMKDQQAFMEGIEEGVATGAASAS